MRPALLAPLLLLSGCLLGVDPYKGAFTPRVEEIRLVEPSVPAEDGQIYAREGTEVVVDIVTTYPIVVGDTGGEGGTGDGPRGPVTQILLEGATEPFEVVEQLDETTWRFRKVLTKDDGNGPKTIRATVVNDFDQAATDASDVLLIADFQAPTAACVLSPRVANTVNTPTLVVTLSEPLQGGLPVVTPSTPDILIDPNPRVVEGQIVYELAGALGANVEDYVLTVTGTDLAGNPQQGDSMCEALDRTGTVLARVPQIVPGQDVRVAATPSVAVEEPVDGLPTLVPRARVGAVVTVEIPTVDPIVPERSTVSLSGLELTHVEGITWSHTLTGNEGEGLKTLDVWLVDAAENTTRLPSRKGVLRFDFTPPAADCVLQPKGANADQQVRFDVFASEALDVGVPAVTADHPNVVVEHDTSVGTQHSFLVRLKEPGNADYVLTVEGNDVAGNPPLGPLCDASERTGTIRGIPPMVAGPPVITTSPSVEVDEDGTVVPRVRVGARITVDIPTVDTIAPTASQITLSGTPLSWNAAEGVFEVVLLGGEGDGLKTLDARLVDPAGNETRAAWPGVVRFDFTPPFADCVLAPDLARGADTVSFQVFASEELVAFPGATPGGPPLVTVDDPRIDVLVPPDGVVGTQHAFGLRLRETVDIDLYTVTVTATDLVGNPQPGDSLCALEDRQGAILGIPPDLSSAPELLVSPSIRVADGDPLLDALPHARDGAELTLTLRTKAELDTAETVITLGDIELLWSGPLEPLVYQWTASLDEAAGDGVKLLDARLVDLAGNRTRIRSGELPAPVGVVADFTPPRATCVIDPDPANAAQAAAGVTLEVFPTEPLDTASLVVTDEEPLVEVLPRTTMDGSLQYDLVLGAPADLDVLVTLTATDRVGNAHEGESLCDEASRTGHFRTIAPAILDDEVVFEASPSVPRPDPARPGVTVPWVRTGAVLTATFAVEAELDVDETSVSLGGLELDPQDETGTVWSVVLDGNEGDGLKDLDLRLVDPWGNVTRERREGVVRFDFTPPAADCALLPPLANAMQPVTFDVFATETLAGPPVVTSSDDRMGLPYQGSAGNQHRFSVIGVPGDNLRYTLTATATDLVGNAQEGPSLCSDEQRTGEIIGRGPALREGEDVVITATPSVDVDGTPWVRAGAHVTVSFPVVEALDPETTVVTLSGLELLWENGTTWGATLTGFEGDGPKTLDARLRDVAGNELRVQRGDVVRFDFTAPVAECVLFPQAAKADDEVVLQVFASEPLAGEDGPTVTPLEPGIDTRLLAAAGSQYDVAIELPAGTDLPVYTVLVTGTDLVGNPQAGDSLCELADRMGSYRGIPPALDPGGPILTVEPPAYEQPLGVPWVRTGALVMVDVPTLAPIDEDATQVTLSGLVLDPVGGQRWVTTLTGGEGDGLKDLRLQLVDDAGNLTPEGRNGVIRFDFTPPVADCALQPVSANGDQQVTFDVFASEALATEPTVTSDESGVVPLFQATTGSQHRYRVMGTEGENLAYRLTATGTDLAGNPQAGASFCDVEERQGEILARRPVLLDATLAATPSVDVDSVPVVRAGATVSVRVRTADPIDVKRTSVSLSGLELTPPDPVGDATDTTWTVPLTGAEGDGLKDLRLRLFDAAGNITDPPVQPGVIRFDFTAPVADCVLTPTLANSTQAITFDVFTSEALDGPPLVTSSVLEVQATYDALASTGNQHRFVVQGAPDQNHAYELTVTATDVAGNPQQGASLCSSSSRTGQIVGRGPQLLDVVFAADPEVRVDDAFWVGAGQWIEVTFTVVEDLDPLTTVVNVSGTPLLHKGGTTWWRQLDGTEGDGPKSLDATLRDPAGNPLRVTRTDVYRFDFTPPTASCVLALSPANAAQIQAGVGFEVRANERLARAPTVEATGVDVLPGLPPLGGTIWPYTLQQPFPADVDYVLTVAAEDLVGNTSEGDALCPTPDRAGRVDATAPTVLPTPFVEVEDDAFVWDDGLRVVRAGAGLVATVVPSEPIVVASSSVTLSGVPLVHVDGTDTWETTLLGGEGDGVKELQIRLVDAVGNSTTTTAPAFLRFDFTPPTATCVLSPEQANAAQATAGIRFEVRASEPLSGAPLLTPTGVDATFADVDAEARDWGWTLTRDPATDGPYSLGIAATDLVGNASAGDTFCPAADREGDVLATPPGLTVDPVLEIETGAPPAVRTAALVDGTETVPAGVTLRVRFTASDTALVPSSLVSLSGLPLAHDAASDSWWVHLDGDEGDGLKDLQIRLVDAVGNSATFTFPGFVRFDFTPPSASCVVAPSPANATQVAAGVSFQVRATEPLGAPPTITQAGLTIGAITPDATNQVWSTTVSQAAPADGTFRLGVTARDRVGNTASGTALCPDADRDVVVKATAPTPEGSITLSVSDDAYVVIDGVRTVKDGVTLTATVVPDAPIVLASSSVTLSGLPLVHVGGNAWEVTLAGDEGDGLKDLQVRLVDDVGNTSTTTVDDIVRFDFTPPTATCVLAPDPANASQASAGIAFEVRATEALAGAPVVTGTGVTPAFVGGTLDLRDWSWAVTQAPPVDGAYHLDVTATDRVGNTATDDALCPLVDRTGSVLATPPEVDPGDGVTLDVVDLGGTARPPVVYDGAPTVPADRVLRVRFTPGPSAVLASSSVTLAGLPLAYDATNRWWWVQLEGDEGDGIKDLQIRLVDAVGNASVTTEEDFVRFDFTPPTATCVLSPTPANGTQAGAGIQFELRASEPVPSAPTLTSPAVAIGTPTADGAKRVWSWSLTQSPATDGAYVLAASATDRVGNTASGDALCDEEDRTGEVIATPPTIGDPTLQIVDLVGTPVPDVTYDGAPTVRAGRVLRVRFARGPSTVLSSSSVTLSGLPLAWSAANAWWWVQLDGDEGDGLKDLQIRLVDAVGNAAVRTEEDFVRFDFTPPSASCVLSPSLANAAQAEAGIRFEVRASEPVPTAPALVPTGIAAAAPSSDPEAEDWTWILTQAPASDGTYSLAVTATDRVGNTASGDALCPAADRTGEVLATAPQVDDTPGPTLEVVDSEGDPVAPVVIDEVPTVTRGVQLRVRFSADPSAILASSTVTLSGLPLVRDPAQDWWTVTLDGDEGDGEKTLQIRVVDAVGNTSLYTEPGFVAFDFTPPSAACSLVPDTANATSDITFTVTTSELTQGAPTLTVHSAVPGITASGPASNGVKHTWTIEGPAATDVPVYELRVTATDRVGNAQQDTSLCPLADRQGSIRGKVPVLVSSFVAASPPGTPTSGSFFVVNTGDVLTLNLDTEGFIDPLASSVALGDLVFDFDQQVGTDSQYNFVHTVTGDDPDGTHDLDATLVDDAGNATRVRFAPGDQATKRGRVIVDNTQPFASCSLTPTSANADSDIVFLLNASEPLSAPPTLTLPDELEVTDVAQNGTTYAYDLALTGPANLAPYVVVATGSDVAGNPQLFASFCDEDERTGAVYGIPPGPVPGDPPSLGFDQGVFDATPGRVKAGATVTVRIPTLAPHVDPARSVVTLSGLRMNPTDLTGTEWTLFVQDDMGDGLKTVSATLVDAAGNTTLVPSAAYPLPDPLEVVFDFTGPSASCVLTPKVALASDVESATEPTKIFFEVTVSEDLGTDPFTGLPKWPEVTLAGGEDRLYAEPWSHAGSTYLFGIRMPVPAVVESYTLDVTATDAVGNDPAGPLCTPPSRMGAIYGVAPEPDLGDIEVRTPSDSSLDGPGLTANLATPWVEVRIPTADPIEASESVVTLSGVELMPEPSPATDPVWRVYLTGTEGDGLKDLDARLIDAAGNQTRVQLPDVIRFDFTRPSATCILQPLDANALDVVTLEVIATEPLLFPPVVTVDPTSDPGGDLAIAPLGESGTNSWLYAVQLTSPATVIDYRLDVAGADLAGNEDDGILCSTGVRPTGSLYGVRPELSEPPGVSIWTDPVIDGPVPTVRSGSTVYVQVPTTSTIDPAATRVRLAGFELAHQSGQTWSRRFDDPTLSGEGTYDLTVELEDPSGNTNAIPIEVEDAVRYDFEAPQAVCRISTSAANLSSRISVVVDVTEPLDVGAPPVGVGAVGGMWLEIDADTPGILAPVFVALNPFENQYTFDLQWTGATPPPLLTFTVSAHGYDTAGNGGPGVDLCSGYNLWGQADLVEPELLSVEATVAPLVSVAHPQGARKTFGGPGTTGFDVVLCTTEDVGGSVTADHTEVFYRDLDLTWVGQTETGSPSCPWRTTYHHDRLSPADDGRYDLVVDLVDVFGNPRRYATGDFQPHGGPVPATGLGGTGTADLVVYADYTPPELASSLLERDPSFNAAIGEAVLQMNAADPISGLPPQLIVSIVATELLGADPILTSSGSLVFGAPQFTAPSRSARWRKLGPFGSDGELVTFEVELEDLVGNIGTAALEMALQVDLTPPSTTPDVDSEGTIVYTRKPWGDGTPGENLGGGEFAANTQYEVEGFADAATPGSTVLVRRAGLGAGDVYGITAVGNDGSFGPLSLPFDLSEIEVAEVDDAGNVGPDVRVRDIAWTAVPGASSGPDDHPFLAPRIAPVRRVPPVDVLDTERATIAPSIRNDGWVAETEGTGTWEDRSRRGVWPGGFTNHAMAFDPSRGVAIVLGGSGAFGGNATWQWDGYRWRQLDPYVTPPELVDHAMAYHAGSDRIVLFGGTGSDGNLSGQTWTWDGESWSYVASTGPVPRRRHGMAYDATHDRVVLFGGEDADGDRLDDTWLWNGIQWQATTPTTRPPARANFGIATSPDDGGVLLFGGSTDASSYTNDTWVWNGTTWSPRTEDPTIPSPRRDHHMVWEAHRNRVTLFGGYDSGGGFSDTWRWSASARTWLRVSTLAPSDRIRFAMAYDSEREEILVHGGTDYTATGSTDQLWAYSGSGWEAFSTDTPHERADHAMTYHAQTGEVVLFGGYWFDVGAADDTWTWTRHGWRQESPSTVPTGRYRHEMVYDTSQSRAVMYGGDAFTLGLLDDTWTWTGSNWVQVFPSGAPAWRSSHAFAYDRSRSESVLFGGVVATSGPFGLSSSDDETHVLSLVGTDTWTLEAQGTPSARTSSAAAFHRTRGTVVLFSGATSGADPDDTWEWNGSSWTRRNTTGTRPSGRHGTTLAWDDGRKELVLFGGDPEDASANDETWGWDGTWRQYDPPRSPPPSDDHAVAEHDGRDSILLFGGGADDGTWEWNGGRDDRPAALLEAVFGLADADAGSALRSATVRWFAGGSAFEESTPGSGTYVPVDGAQLVVWDRGAWVEVDAHASDADAPEELCWTVVADASVSGVPSCSYSIDAVRLASLFLGDDRSVHVGARPVGTNGSRGTSNPNGAYARITTDYAEVTVRYRLPAPP